MKRRELIFLILSGAITPVRTLFAQQKTWPSNRCVVHLSGWFRAIPSHGRAFCISNMQSSKQASSKRSKIWDDVEVILRTPDAVGNH